MIVRSIAAAAIAVSFLAPVANATSTKTRHLADAGIISSEMVQRSVMKIGMAHCRKGTMLKKGKCTVSKIKKLPHMM